MNPFLGLVVSLVFIALMGFGLTLFAPGWDREIWTGAFLAGSAGIVLQLLSSLSGGKRPGPSLFDEALTTRRRAIDRPADLQVLERALGWGIYSGVEYDHRVRPVLRRAAEARLRGAPRSPVVAELISEAATPQTMRTAQIANVVSQIEEMR